MKKIFFAVSLMVLTFGCSESDRDESDTTVSSYEYARAENTFFDVWKTVHRVVVADTVLGGMDSTFSLESCFESAVRVPDLGPYPIELTLTFKSEGEMCDDGRVRKGAIKASFSAPYSDSGSVVDISFDNYSIDDQSISGTMQLVNLGNDSGLPKFTKTVREGWLRRAAPGNQRQEIYFNSDQTVTWGIGNDTYKDPSDDEFRASGSANGRNTFGNFFNARITSEIITNVSCVYEGAGKVELNQNTLSTRLLDYGSACDSKIQVTFNGGSVTDIILP